MKAVSRFTAVRVMVIALLFVFAGVALAQDGGDDANTERAETEMQILQINFNYDMTATEYEETVAPLADAIANVDGLVWKVWVINDEAKEAGGIYLFQNAAAVDAYMSSEIVAGIASHPKITDIRAKQFDVMESVSTITRAPLEVKAKAQ
jgi:hypothetical protein